MPPRTHHHPHREHLQLQDKMPPQPDLTRWRELATSVDTFEKEVKIAIVGKVGRKEGAVDPASPLKQISAM